MNSITNTDHGSLPWSFFVQIEDNQLEGGLRLKKISYYIKQYWYVYFFAIVCMVVAIVLDMIYPIITQKIIDDVIIGGQLGLLKGLLISIFFVGLGRGICGYLKEFIFDWVSSKIGADMRKNLFSHIQSLSSSYFDRTNTGELMARVKDDIDHIWNALGFVGMLIIEVVIHTCIVLFCMFQVSKSLFILPCIIIPMIGAVAIIMERKLNRVYEEISEENAVLNTVAEENLAGVRTVKAFAREKYEIKKFLSHNQKYYSLNMEQAKILTRFQPIFQFVSKLLPVVSIILGGVMVIRGSLTLGALVAFSEYTRNIVWPMEILGWLMNDLSSAIASNKKVKKIYGVIPEIKEKDSPTMLEQIKGEIEFKHVSFQLQENSILKDISFHIKSGKTLGIMGATGSGKSSIIHLLQRFYDTTEGDILLDGINIKDLSLKQLRGSMSLVMQDIFLFSDTIKENIKLGQRERIHDHIVRESASFAEADSFIERMEEQYDTIIGERGVGLSGGQKQRISIARAVAKKNPILIMDDSTSALDMETEYAIQQSLSELSDMTKIIIAHRISAVRNADEIIFLEKGEIKERGTHEELLKKRGLYYQTYLAQYGNYKEVKEQCQ